MSIFKLRTILHSLCLFPWRGLLSFSYPFTSLSPTAPIQFQGLEECKFIPGCEDSLKQGCHSPPALDWIWTVGLLLPVHAAVSPMLKLELLLPTCASCQGGSSVSGAEPMAATAPALSLAQGTWQCQLEGDQESHPSLTLLLPPGTKGLRFCGSPCPSPGPTTWCGPSVAWQAG